MMRSKLDKQTILIFLLLFPHMKPPSLVFLAPLVETAYDVGRLLSAVLIILLMVAERKKPSPALTIFALLELWIIIVTAFFNTQYTVGALINCSSVVIVFAIVEYYSRRAPDQLLQALMASLGWIMVVNLITVLVYYPEGIYKADEEHADFFLGQKNSFITFVLPACTAALLAFCAGRRLSPLIVMAAGIVPVLITWSATSVVGLLLMALVLFLGLRGKNRILRPTYIWLITLLADYLITVRRILDHPGPLNTFITQVLHKNVTLTGRTEIWDVFYTFFQKRPFLGYGFRQYMQVGEETAYHAHNTYFQFLLLGGIVALALFFLYNIAILYRIERLPPSRVKLILTASLAAVYVMHLSEAENSIMSAVILALANNAEFYAVSFCGPEAGPSERHSLPEDVEDAPEGEESP